MKILFLLLAIIMSNGNILAQNPTKQESLDALKQTLQGQIINYDWGAPCSNDSGKQYKNPNYITINTVKYEYSTIFIEYSLGSGGGNIIRQLNMNNYFVIYGNAIFESKKNISSGSCEDFVNMGIAFADNTTSAQERCLKILNYLKNFAVKDPFAN